MASRRKFDSAYSHSDGTRGYNHDVWKYEIEVEATEISVCRGYLLLDYTIEDEHEDCYRRSQEIEIDEDGFTPSYFNID